MSRSPRVISPVSDAKKAPLKQEPAPPVIRHLADARRPLPQADRLRFQKSSFERSL